MSKVAPLLEVSGLRKTFGGVHAVEDVSFQVMPGETVSIIGPNGSGKTTTFNVISGMLRPDDGRVVFAGRRIDGWSPERIAELGLARTFQNGRVFGNMTVAGNVRLESIDAFYGPVQALHAVSLRVDPGEIVCLLGGNASGKSTTMKVILGLLKPKAGDVYLDGQRVTQLSTPDRIRRGVASVPEARHVVPAMTVEENLRMGAYLRRGPGIDDDLRRAYALFPRLAERRRQLAGTMSGGEQQMLAMARALMARPKLICMDEPTMGLAPIFVDTVLDLIVEINRGGVSVFMVEQNATLALSIATRGYVLQSGAMRLEGAARDLASDPAVREAYLGARSHDASSDQAGERPAT